MTDRSIPPGYLPTMTQDYSGISDTAKAITDRVLPIIAAYLQSEAPRIAGMNPGEPFVIADFGAADGVNESILLEEIVRLIHAINPSLPIRIYFIDIADRAVFDLFWKSAKLAQVKGVEADYLQRSFYEPFPEIAGRLRLGFSSTAMHWLDTKNRPREFFQHPGHIQPNQLPDQDRRKFVEKWKSDWEVFFRHRSAELVPGGALFLANLAWFGGDCWPASAGYNNLRDVCSELCKEGRISDDEWNAVFVPDYFATPEEMKVFLKNGAHQQDFTLKTCEEITVPCAYFTPVEKKLAKREVREELADKLARVVRAWSESSIKTGLSSENKPVVDEIYRRLRERFNETPQGLPYQYCLLEIIRK